MKQRLRTTKRHVPTFIEVKCEFYKNKFYFLKGTFNMFSLKIRSLSRTSCQKLGGLWQRPQAHRTPLPAGKAGLAGKAGKYREMRD